MYGRTVSGTVVTTKLSARLSVAVGEVATRPKSVAASIDMYNSIVVNRKQVNVNM